MTDKKKYSAKVAVTSGRKESASISVPDVLFEGDCSASLPQSSRLMKVSKLVPSARNPYHVTYGPDDPWMRELCESIRKQGVLSPLIVRPIEDTDTYEIISGHRRHHAAKQVGLEKVPVIVRDMTDDEAAIQMVDYNLNREELLFSEKAFAYRLKYEALKHTWGGARQNTHQKSPGDSCSGNALNDIAEQIGISPSSVRNYLNLTRLCEELLEAVDRKTIPMKAGVQLSYLRKDMQRSIWQNLKCMPEHLNEKKAEEIRRYCEKHPDATKEDLLSIMSAEMSQTSEQHESEVSKEKTALRRFRLTKAVRRKYFPETTSDEEIYEVIHSLLHMWATEHNPDYRKED